MDLVTIPGGVFEMGSSIEEVNHCVEEWGKRLVDSSYDIEQFRTWILKEFPRHEVRINTFQIGKFLVTNAEYLDFVKDEGYEMPESLRLGKPLNHPVWGVSYFESEAFVNWYSRKTGIKYIIPTEAQWEYAARGSSSRRYPFGDIFDPERCNTLESGLGDTTPVDRYSDGISEFGVFDMAGNVEEWTSSIYYPYPGGKIIEDDISKTSGFSYYVLRGGSFARGGDLARCARRHGPHPAPPFRFRGFRVAHLME
ncbi:MAG: formylglycine-generating enzyme family protein [Symploca sp. SIO2D2]|nr:formylglycine-generating enzyme family protein [Symploca sp. SIO2D2]